MSGINWGSAFVVFTYKAGRLAGNVARGKGRKAMLAQLKSIQWPGVFSVTVALGAVLVVGLLSSGSEVLGDEQAAPPPGSEGTNVQPASAEATPLAAPNTGELAAVSAADLPPLRVVGRVPLPNEAFTGRVTVFFDDELVPPADANGHPVPPLVFDPPIVGVWKTVGNGIDFQMERPPRPSSLYDVRVSPYLVSKSGRKAVPDKPIFTVSNMVFAPSKVWMVDKTPTTITLGMKFNIAPDIAQLQAQMTATDANGNAVSFTVQPGTSEDSSNVRLLCNIPAAMPIWFTVPPGIEDSSHRITTTREETLRFPENPEISLKSIKWLGYTDHPKGFQVSFSHQVSGTDLQQHLSLTDASTGQPEAFTVDPSALATDITVTLTIPATENKTYVVAIEPGLTSNDLARLSSPVSQQLVYAPETAQSRQGPKQSLSIEYAWWDRRGKDGVWLQFRLNEGVSLEAMKEHLSFSPAIEIADLRYEGWGEYHVYAPWNPGDVHQIVLSPGLQDESGQHSLDGTLRYALDPVPEVKGAGFPYPGKFYFPRRNGTQFLVETRNMEKVDVSVSRLFPSNIAVALESMESDEGSWEFDEQWAEELKTTSIRIEKKPNQLVRTPIELRELFDENWRGVFRLRTSEYGEGKLIVWTDIGVLAQWQSDEVVVFAHDLTTLEPLALAKVTAYSSKNQLLGSVNTDASGIAMLKALNKSLGRPAVVVVETQNDYTFLELERRDDDPVEYDGNMPGYDRDGYDAFVYADRDLYRPGETAHLRWIARTNYGDALANVPLKLTVTRPNGSVMLSEAVTLSALGTGVRDLSTAKIDPTGRYTVTLTAPGSSRTVGLYNFSLEEFVPNRIAVEVGQDAPVLVPGTVYPVRVNAKYLFGAPAAAQKCEAEVALLKGSFKSDRWKEFQFTNSDEYDGELVSVGSAQTDAEGNAVFEYTPELPGKATFPLRAIIRGRVFELGGRAVTATKEATIFPGDVCLGITAAAAPDGKGAHVFVAAITPDESPAALEKVVVTLEREEWSYYVRQYDGYNDWRWTKVFRQVESREVPLAEGRGETTFTITGYGYYRVKVSSEATPQFSTVQFYSYWDGRVELVTEARPSLVKLTLNKSEYAVGEEVEARIESPFDGAGVAIVQGDGIRRVFPVQVVGGTGTVRFAVDSEDVPNVWLEVTVAHKAAENSEHVYPYASFAMANVPVRNPRRALAVSFPELPVETLPAKEWPVTIEIRDNTGAPVTSELTLAAVDEGIHALSDYRTPNPYQWLMRFRRPEFNRAHYYDKVAYDFGKTPIGGDGMASRVGKDAPFVGDNWIKPVALWSGVVTTDANGRATVTLPLPEFSGQLRLVAVACTDAALGAGEGKVFVRRPFMLRTSMPRFALPGDRFQARVAVFNTTQEPRTARISWTGSGTLQGQGGQELVVPASAEAAATAEFTAGPALGQGELLWKAEILDAAGAVIDTLTESAPIPVRPPAQYQTANELVVLSPGENRTFTNTRFIDAENSTIDIAISANPALRLQEALRFLAGYPYGCVEQTTSRCLPMYMLRRSERLLSDEYVKKDNLLNYLQAGVDRLFSMQTSNGGLGYWPGATDAYSYGSVYACHFITLVRRDGELYVPEPSFKALQNYVRAIANDWSSESGYFKNYRDTSSLYLRAYAHYVLALDGDIDAIRQISRFDNLALPEAARYLLAAAIAINTQDTDRVKMYLQSAPMTPDDVREQAATLNSDMRNKAVRLLALLQMNADEKQCYELATELMHYLESHRYGTTQETAFICTALGEYFGRFATDPAAFSATVAGPEGEAQVKAGDVYTHKHKGPGGAYTVANTGGGPVFVNLTTGGTPAQLDMQAISKGLTVTRQTLTLQGAPVPDNVFAQGASYVVILTIDSTNSVENVIMDDMLPAGFEIENPRLDPEVMAGVEMPETTAASYLEVRDDRLVAAFDALDRGQHHFCYVVRAITAGEFQRPGVHAECMYDTEIRGTTTPETVQVK